MLPMPTDALPAPTSDVLSTLTSGLSAYGRLYGLPNSPEQVRGILATLLRLYQPDRPALAVDQVAQQVLDGLSPEALKAAIVDRASSALAKAAHRWQQHLEQQMAGTITAYGQRYGPILTPETLRRAATAVAPLLEGDRPTTVAEVIGLVSHLVQTFDPEGAIATAIDPAYLALAEKLAISLSQKPLEVAVGETIIAYVAKYAPTLTNIGSDLISTALSAVLKNQTDFSFDTQLAVVDEQLLIEQVSFQLNILRQSPAPSKAALAIAAEVNTAVGQYRREHNHQEGTVDVTTGLLSNDGLSVSSSWTSTRPLLASPPDGGDLR